MSFSGRIGVSELLGKKYEVKKTTLNISSFPGKNMLLGEMVFDDDTWVFPQEVSLGESKASGVVLQEDSTLTGFIQSVKYGLIKLSATDTGTKTVSQNQTDTDWGVYRTGNMLNGYAWNDAIGWICFGSCTEGNASLSIESEEYSEFFAFLSLLFNLRVPVSVALLSILLFVFLITEKPKYEIFVQYIKRLSLLQKPPKA
jgi:hypothetical protein